MISYFQSDLKQILNQKGNHAEQPGEWLAIYYEPKFNSGERITVAVVAIFDHYKPILFRTMNESVLAAMFGAKKGANYDAVIDIGLDSISAQLENCKALSELQTIFTGFYIGQPHKTQSFDLKELIKQGIEACASTCSEDYFESCFLPVSITSTGTVSF